MATFKCFKVCCTPEVSQYLCSAAKKEVLSVPPTGKGILYKDYISSDQLPSSGLILFLCAVRKRQIGDVTQLEVHPEKHQSAGATRLVSP